MNMSRLVPKAVFSLFFLVPALVAAKGPHCSEEALSAAKKLLAFHAGFEASDPSSSRIVKNNYLGAKSSQTKDGPTLEIFDIRAMVDPAGYYDMDISVMAFDGSCMGVRQGIQEAWIDDRFQDPPRAKRKRR
jgi:hypothetical protein